MVESLRRLRQPVVVVLLVALALRLVLDVVGLAQVLRGGARASSDVVSGSVAVTAGDGLTLVVLAVLVGSCVLWSPTRHARTLTIAATVLTALTLLVFVVAVAAVLAASGGTGGWAAVPRVLLELVVPLLVVMFLATLWRGQSTAAPSAAPDSEQGSLPATAAPQASTPALEAGPNPDAAPVWQPDEAAGAAWLTAGDAAAGAAASRWGTPGDAGSWQPHAVRQPDRAQSDRLKADRFQPGRAELRPASPDPTRPEGPTGA